MTENTDTTAQPDVPGSREPAPSPAPRRRTRVAVGVVLVAALAGGAVGAVGTSSLSSQGTETTTVVREAPTQEATPAASTGESLSVSEIYREVADGVVEIAVTSSAGEGPFGEGGTQRGQGSGFVYDDAGHVITNYHVVEGATEVEVTLADGSTHPARVVGSDASTDVAVLEVDAPDGALVPLAIGDSDALEVGEPVVAIGSPFGLDATVTAGIVSALERRIASPNGFAIDDAIQTDAAINQGNSGGPLLNAQAEVVGVNSQIETESGGNVGIGFAVPTSTVREVVSQILESGSVEHAYLGVGVQTIPADVAEQLGATAGVALTEVREGGPAAAAGLQAATGSQTIDGVPYPTGGDVVTEVEGTAVATAEELQDAIAEQAAGDEIELTVLRDGETQTVAVTLGTRPD